METINIRVPESVHKSLKELAEKDSVSINQFVTTAITEKISAFMTKKYLEDRGKRGSKKKFMAALARIPDVEPGAFDRL